MASLGIASPTWLLCLFYNSIRIQSGLLAVISLEQVSISCEDGLSRNLGEELLLFAGQNKQITHRAIQDAPLLELRMYESLSLHRVVTYGVKRKALKNVFTLGISSSPAVSTSI